MIVATIFQFKGVIGNLAVVLLGPYLLWVSYASALTIWIWRNNTPAVTHTVSNERRGPGAAGLHRGGGVSRWQGLRMVTRVHHHRHHHITSSRRLKCALLPVLT